MDDSHRYTVHRESTGAAGYKLFGHRLRSLSYCGFASLRSLPYVNSTIQPEEDIAKSKHCLHRVNSLILQLMDQYIYSSKVSYRMGHIKYPSAGVRESSVSTIVGFVDLHTLARLTESSQLDAFTESTRTFA